jgi:hypothetical protein
MLLTIGVYALGFFIGVCVGILVESKTETIEFRCWQWQKGNKWNKIIMLKDGRRFLGGCTVWHHYPSGIRASSFLEHKLSNIDKYIEFNEIGPTIF